MTLQVKVASSKPININNNLDFLNIGRSNDGSLSNSTVLHAIDRFLRAALLTFGVTHTGATMNESGWSTFSFTYVCVCVCLCGLGKFHLPPTNIFQIK